MAQSVEQLIRNQQVAGSIPASSSKEKTSVNDHWRFFFYRLEDLSLYEKRYCCTLKSQRVLFFYAHGE